MNAVLRFSGRTAGRRLRRQHQKMFPGWPPGSPIGTAQWQISTAEWQAAAGNGATIGWALRAADTTAEEATSHAVWEIADALHLASAIPISVIDGLLADGWTARELAGLFNLMGWWGFRYASVLLVMAWQSGAFSPLETARRLEALHRAAPDTIGYDGRPLPWHTGMAVLTAQEVGLTDMQALRWFQLLMPEPATRLKWFEPEYAGDLQEWAEAAGPDGWAWAAAGFTPAETRRLRALPAGHPDRPGPDQLAVMAALR